MKLYPHYRIITMTGGIGYLTIKLGGGGYNRKDPKNKQLKLTALIEESNTN